MRAAVAAILLPFVAASALLDPRNGHCGGDNCARQVTGTRDGLSPASSRRTDCSSFMKTTVIPDATYVRTLPLPSSPFLPQRSHLGLFPPSLWESSKTKGGPMMVLFFSFSFTFFFFSFFFSPLLSRRHSLTRSLQHRNCYCYY